MTIYPQIISIEGNIGSGKSTLLLKLQEIYKNNPDIYFVDEPVNIWNEVKDKDGITILEKYYGSGSGKMMRILWIRIRTTAAKSYLYF